MVSYHRIIEQIESFYPNDTESFCIYYSFDLFDHRTMVHKYPSPAIYLNNRTYHLIKIITSQEIQDTIPKSRGIYHALEAIYPKSEHDSIRNITHISSKGSKSQCCDMDISPHQVRCPCCKKPIRRLEPLKISSPSLSDIIKQFKIDVEILEQEIKNKKKNQHSDYVKTGVSMVAGLVGGMLLGGVIGDTMIEDTQVPAHSHDITQLNLSPPSY